MLSELDNEDKWQTREGEYREEICFLAERYDIGSCIAVRNHSHRLLFSWQSDNFVLCFIL